ncbi:MAG: aryl-sulfate sulfotransferase [Bdellovibrionales bacterium]|nr:aryl-sulfate sulfotransferase [Bdellovibrionales bacterium]
MQRLLQSLQLPILLVAAIAALIYLKPGSEPTKKPQETPFKKSNAVSTKGKPYPGLTLVPLTGTASVVLLALDGSVVHEWPVDATRARLLPNGNLLVIHGSKWGLKVEPWKSLRKTVREYDWDGNVVWEKKVPDIAHHDIQRLENGNTIFPVRVMVPAKFKEQINDLSRRTMKIRSDAITEVNPAGEIVWEWNAHEHLDLNNCGRRPCTVHTGGDLAAQKMSDWTHINTVSVIPENKWYDQGDKRFKPGNLLTLPRNFWTVFLIDKETKDVVWEYTGDYKRGLSGGHEVHMIPKGIPGEGNILIFDNGRVYHKGKSYILEVNPTTNELVWVYDRDKEFFSNSAGSMQRFPNGNMLISEDVRNRVFEINPKGDIIWEFKTDYRLSRSQRYDYDYCPQFKDLKFAA